MKNVELQFDRSWSALDEVCHGHELRVTRLGGNSLTEKIISS